MARENPTRTPTGILTFLGGLVVLVIFALIVVYWIRSNAPVANVTTKRDEARKNARLELQKKHAEQLQSTGWNDKAKGVAHVPVTDAMKLALVELQAKKPGASTVKVEPAIVVPPSIRRPNRPRRSCRPRRLGRTPSPSRHSPPSFRRPRTSR